MFENFTLNVDVDLVDDNMGEFADTAVEPLYRCTTCAALVDASGIDTHTNWHAILDTMMKQVHF